jgi:hypothetical protein
VSTPDGQAWTLPVVLGLQDHSGFLMPPTAQGGLGNHSTERVALGCRSGLTALERFVPEGQGRLLLQAMHCFPGLKPLGD